MFKFLQEVNTPQGPGLFIGYLTDGQRVQVSRWTTRDGKRICINPIYPAETITARQTTEVRKPKPEPRIQVVDVAFI